MSVSPYSSNKSFLWAVKRPVEGKIRRSSKFLIGNGQCVLVFSSEGKRYMLSIHNIVGCIDCVHVTVHVRSRSQLQAARFLSTSTFAACQGKIVWNQEESDILRSIPDFLKDGLLIFLVIVDTNEAENKTELELPTAKSLPQKSEVQTEDKSVQTCGFMIALPSSSRDVSGILEDLPSYRDNGEPDIELSCGRERVKAHKCVLSNQSRVLEQLAQKEVMQGGETGCILVLWELQPDLFLPLVRFLYSGQVPPDMTVDSAMRFYKTAQKYGLAGLATACARFLEVNLRPDNACEILVVAEEHNDSEFKAKVVDYIIQKKIPLNDNLWRHFGLRHPVLALSVATRFCRMQDK